MRFQAYMLPALLAFVVLMGCAQQGGAGVPPSSSPPPSSPPSQPPPPPPPSMNGTGGGSGAPSMNGSGGAANQTAPPATPPSMNSTNASGSGQQMNQTTPPSMNSTNATAGGPSMNGSNATTAPPPPPQLPTEFSVDANDGGFYMSGSTIDSLTVPAGKDIVITFNVLTTEVYHGGLDFKGCGQSVGGTSPGHSTDFRFTARGQCSITSYWPSTGVSKKTLQIMTQ